MDSRRDNKFTKIPPRPTSGKNLKSEALHKAKGGKGRVIKAVKNVENTRSRKTWERLTDSRD